MHIYVFWRAASVPLLVAHVPMRLLIGTGVILWGIFFAGRVYGHRAAGTLPAAVELIGMTWMAVLFLLFVSLLALDLATGFGLIFRRLAPPVRGWALLLGGALSVIALVQGLRPPVIQHYEVRLPGLPDGVDGTVLVAMSDLHIGSLLGARWFSARVAQVMAQDPDLVCLLGDIFEGHGLDRDELLPALRRVSAPLGVWAVAGNHEFHHGSSMSMRLMKEAGVQLLRNRRVEIWPGLILAGVDDLTSDGRNGTGGRSRVPGPLGPADGCDRPPLAHPLGCREGFEGRRWADAQRPHARGPDLAFWLSDPHQVPAAGRAI